MRWWTNDKRSSFFSLKNFLSIWSTTIQIPFFVFVLEKMFVKKKKMFWEEECIFIGKDKFKIYHGCFSNCWSIDLGFFHQFGFEIIFLKFFLKKNLSNLVNWTAFQSFNCYSFLFFLCRSLLKNILQSMIRWAHLDK